MNRSVRNTMGVVAALVIISVLVITQQSTPQQAEARTGAQPGASSSSSGQMMYAHQPGAPGIQASLGSGAVTAFTENDVHQYFATHDAMYQMAGAEKPTITQIQFLSAKDAGAQLNQQLDREDDAIVCIVTLHGTFVAAGPPSAGAGTGSVNTMIFDGRTGNLIGDLLKIDKTVREPRQP